LAVVAGGCEADGPTREPSATRPNLALMSSLPLYWGENESFESLLAPGGDAGWVRPALEARFELTPLDALDAPRLAGHRLLLLAQPRVLSPEENIALDAWVRGGGRVLIFADPLLTAHSIYPVGDKRRPQDVALLSPILSRWGLELFEEEGPEGRRMAAVSGIALPVDIPGRFRVSGSSCSVSAEGLLAQCRIGRGRATLFADAALLEEDEHSEGDGSAAALTRLTELAFD
jgi:hypothetical protein